MNVQFAFHLVLEIVLAIQGPSQQTQNLYNICTTLARRLRWSNICTNVLYLLGYGSRLLQKTLKLEGSTYEKKHMGIDIVIKRTLL